MYLALTDCTPFFCTLTSLVNTRKVTVNMAPGFDTLSDHDFDDEEDLDFSDLHQQFDVRMEEGLDAFVVSISLLSHRP